MMIEVQESIARPAPIGSLAAYEKLYRQELIATLRQQVRRVIGPIATPDKIQIAGGLPKTRSGKIMCRILRKIAAGQVDEMGDVTTLADPGVVDDLLAAANAPSG